MSSKLFEDEVSMLKIFSYLPLRSLNNCKAVCKLWYNLVKEAKIKRKGAVQTLSYHSLNDLIEIDSDGMLLRDFNKKLNAELDKAMFEPDFAIVLMTKYGKSKLIIADEEDNEIINEQDSCESNTKGNKRASGTTYNLRAKKVKISMKPYEILRKMLPNVNTLFMFTSGVTTTDYSNVNTIEIEAKKPELGISALLLPKSEHYRVKIVNFANKDEKKFENISTIKEFKELFELDESNNEELKYLMIFGDQTCNLDTNGLFDLIKKHLKNKFAICGSYIDTYEYIPKEVTPSRAGKKRNLMLIGFIGKENVFAQQIVVPYTRSGDDTNPKSTAPRHELLKKRLNELKSSKNIYLNKTTFAVQIACCSRGRDYYAEESYEAKQFKSVFPTVPLIGLFGYGELGIDYLTVDDQTKKPCASSEDPRCTDLRWMGYSSVFSLISVKL